MPVQTYMNIIIVVLESKVQGTRDLVATVRDGDHLQFRESGKANRAVNSLLYTFKIIPSVPTAQITTSVVAPKPRHEHQGIALSSRKLTGVARTVPKPMLLLFSLIGSGAGFLNITFPKCVVIHVHLPLSGVDGLCCMEIRQADEDHPGSSYDCPHTTKPLVGSYP